MEFWRTPAGVQREYVDGRFGQLHYRIVHPPRASRHPPLLCFHLSPNSGRVFARFMAAMGSDRIVIAPDTPGFGQSDAPASQPRIADYAAAMGELADRLRLQEFDALGYHTGARIAVELAQQRPAQLRRVVMISAPVYTAEEHAAITTELARPEVDETPADGSHLLRRWQGHWQWKDPQAPASFVQREVCEGLRGGPNAWWGHAAAFGLDYRVELPKLQQPVLVLCPDDDLRTATLRARPLVRNGRFVELRGFAHGFLDVHTDAAVAQLRDFLDAPAAQSGAAPVAKPALPPPPRAEHRVRRAYFKGPYGALHYRIATPTRPAAPPIFMFHMSPSSGRTFMPMLLELGRDRIAVAPDTPGFGDSEAPPEPIGIEDYAASMAALIDSLGFAQVDVMGYHTGAMTCIALALLRPQLVRRIVQISSPVFSDAELAAFRAHYAARPLREDGGHLRDSWISLQKYYGPEVPRQVLADHFAEGLQGGPAAHWGHRAAFNYDLRLHLPRVTQPILVVSPNDDLATQSERGPPLMRNGRIHRIADHAHGFMAVMPAEFGALLRSFLDDELVR